MIALSECEQNRMQNSPVAAEHLGHLLHARRGITVSTFLGVMEHATLFLHRHRLLFGFFLSYPLENVGYISFSRRNKKSRLAFKMKFVPPAVGRLTSVRSRYKNNRSSGDERKERPCGGEEGNGAGTIWSQKQKWFYLGNSSNWHAVDTMHSASLRRGNTLFPEIQ